MIVAFAALAIGGAAQAQPASPAQAPAQTGYPASADAATLSAWLRQATDIPPEQVVAVSPSAATAIVSHAPAANGRIDARLRAVAITPQAAARSGVLAWEMLMEVNCKSGEVRPGATVGFATRRAGGDGVPLAPADTDWRRPKPNTTLDASLHAVCDAHFQPPLTATRIAQAAPAKPAPSPSPSPSPSPVAAAQPPTPVKVAAPKPSPAPAPAPLPATPVIVASNAPAQAPTKPAPPQPAPVNVASAAPAQASRSAAAPPSETPKPPRPPPPAAAAAAAAKPKPAAPAMTGHVAVQVVSSPVEAETRKKLAALQRKFGDTLRGAETRVESAQVNGHTVYRGVIAGFATRGDARAFCQTLKQGGHDCMAR